jgi:hypothetical protein
MINNLLLHSSRGLVAIKFKPAEDTEANYG